MRYSQYLKSTAYCGCLIAATVLLTACSNGSRSHDVTAPATQTSVNEDQAVSLAREPAAQHGLKVEAYDITAIIKEKDRAYWVFFDKKERQNVRGGLTHFKVHVTANAETSLFRGL